MSFDTVIDQIASDLVNFISEEGELVNLCYIEKRLETLELLLNFNSNSWESQSAQCMEKERAKYQAACHETDITSILDSVKKAEKARLDKLEYEAMAQLLNRTGSKAVIIESLTSLKALANQKASDAAELDRRTQIRRLALTVLTHLIPSIQQSLLHEPEESVLPPIEGIDRNSFSIIDNSLT